MTPTSPTNLESRRQDVLAFLLTGTAYYVGAKLGLKLAFLHPSATPVWPPTGIALAAVVLRGYRLWPAIFIAAFIANLTTAGSVATSIGIAVGNTLEAILGAFLARRFASGRNAFDRSSDIFRWTLFAAGLAPTVSATVGLLSLTWGGYANSSDFGRLWVTWWLGDVGSALVVAPFLILWLRDPRIRPSPRQGVEAALIALLFLGVGVLVFGVPFRLGSRTFPLPGTLPLLAWAGFRLGRRGTAAAVLALSALAIWGTLEGQGSFVQRSRTVSESLLFLQIFLAVSSATALAVAASVNERKEAEESLALLAAAVRSSEDAITVVSPQGTILRWNRAAEQLYEYAEAEARGKPISIIIPEARRAQEQATLERVVRGERIDHYETVRQRKSGALVDVSLTISPVKDREGRIVAVSKTARDVTEQKRARKEIVRLNTELEARVQERTARLEAAVRELESFTYSVAHDLRAPLRAIHQFCDLLLEEKTGLLDEEGKDWMRRVIGSADRMDALIASLLAYSRIGREELVLSPQELSAIVPEILSSMKAELDERKATVEVEPSLPRVLGHTVPLTQCLTNLISNAVKFVPASRTPLVRIYALRKDGMIRLVVEDNGIGIDERHRQRLFRIFQRLHSVDEYPGTGIGLAIVKKAAEQMRGSAGFEAGAGQGTRFFLDLPAP